MAFTDTYQALIFDIEGTITDIRFVADVLFPYARKHMPTFLREQGALESVAKGIEMVRIDMGQGDASLDAVIAQLDEWMAQDKKIGSLKYLQGLVWRSGFERSEYQGHFYDEVPAALRAFRSQGKALYIYSSGSVEAQLLLLQYSKFGDMRALFDGHFDTGVGGKLEAGSYVKIGQQIGFDPRDCLFFSDNTKELEAAREAGMDVVELRREVPKIAPKVSAQGWNVWSELHF